MSKLFSRLAAALFYLALAPIASAAPPLTGNDLGKQAFHGPGSRGFHATCSGVFSVTNNLKGSSNFTSAFWPTAFSAGTSAPVVSGPVTAPDGTSRAYQVSFPAVSGAGHFTVLDQATTAAAYYPYTAQVWAQVVSAAGNGTIYLTESVSTNFSRAAVPADGQWHLVQVTPQTGRFTVPNLHVQIGVNLVDTGQSATSGAIVVNLWNASLITYPLSKYVTAANISGPLATTSAAVTAPLNIPCSPGVAFRNFNEALPSSGLAPVTSNPILAGRSSALFEAGGISNPYVNSPLYYNGYYWGFANATSTVTHTDWMSFALFKSKDGITWTEDTTNAPYLQTFGSNFAAPKVVAGGRGYGASVSGTMTWTGANCPLPLVLNVTTDGTGAISSATYSSGVCTTGHWPSTQTTWSPGRVLRAGAGAEFSFSSTHGTGAAAYWQLHPAWLTFGCNVSGTAYSFCIIFGAKNPAGRGALFLAYSSTINGVYTVYGCTSGTCSDETPIAPITSVPNAPRNIAENYLPSVVNVGGINGVNYIYTSNNKEAGPYTNVWTTPANPTIPGAGTTLTWRNTALPQKVRGVDWDYGFAYEDSQVILNKCGFYEYFYTIYGTNAVGTAKSQVIGYAVAPSPDGPWWKYPASIIPATSPMYHGAPYLGDASPIVLNGQFVWLGNYDNGTNDSKAVAAVMQDACSY
jgi:hypothetical protein